MDLSDVPTAAHPLMV